MSFEPTLFASTMFETANETVLFCKEHLDKSYPQLAAQLEMFVPVKDEHAALFARNALRDALPHVDSATAEYVHMALDTVERALGESTSALERAKRAMRAVA